MSAAPDGFGARPAGCCDGLVVERCSGQRINRTGQGINRTGRRCAVLTTCGLTSAVSSLAGGGGTHDQVERRGTLGHNANRQHRRQPRTQPMHCLHPYSEIRHSEIRRSSLRVQDCITAAVGGVRRPSCREQLLEGRPLPLSYTPCQGPVAPVAGQWMR